MVPPVCPAPTMETLLRGISFVPSFQSPSSARSGPWPDTLKLTPPRRGPSRRCPRPHPRAAPLKGGADDGVGGDLPNRRSRAALPTSRYSHQGVLRRYAIAWRHVYGLDDAGYGGRDLALQLHGLDHHPRL